ncbi:MAG: DEAD/DEAH box helicase family protein, partial [Pseudorhodobacter sp.]|nr:DEAD/DEAH box helicase family protein [Pseudorhodobacter sp.]
SGSLDKESRIHVSTIQTFMECYQEFSIGAFDVIIADECHRSIYNKWKDVFTYFDAIQIGLTATPSDWIDRDTFRFFECDDGKPTALYLYEDAIKEGYLADYQVVGVQTHFQIEGVEKGDLPDTIKKKLLEEGMDEDELNWDGTDIEKKIAVLGTNEAIVKEFMENCLLDESGTLPAKTIIFAVSKKHAKRIWESFEKLYPEYKGRLTRIITSESSRAQDELNEFKKESFPRIAISVDMLDTGVDVPEVCNLVFAKPVFSKIKFWQMVGRGTRHNSVCKHKGWLPYGEKKNFLIFDFWNNFEYFDLHPKGKEASAVEAVTTRIMKVRIQKLKCFEQFKDLPNMVKIQGKIIDSINKLPSESISVKENIHFIEQVKEDNFWNGVGLDYAEFLTKKIMPLMRYQQDINPFIASFELKCGELSLSILKRDEKAFARAKEKITEWLRCLPTNLQQVKDKKELLNRLLSKEFWEGITYDDVEMLEKEFAPLMPYKRKEPRSMIILDIDDVVQQRKLIEYSPDGKEEYVDIYRKQIEEKVYELATSDPTVMKIKEGEVVYGEDIEKLEESLNSADLYINES